MTRKYLVIEDIRDCKGNPKCFAVVGAIITSLPKVKVIDAISMDEQTAQQFRETMRRHGAMEKAED
jgi:hypothetical protein